MKNYKSEGSYISFTAPNGGVESGKPVIIGDLFVIPTYSAAANYECEGATVGVFELAKLSTDKPTQFAPAYWDDAESLVTTSAGGIGEGAVANKQIGVFMDALGSGTDVADVRLNGVSI